MTEDLASSEPVGKVATDPTPADDGMEESEVEKATTAEVSPSDTAGDVKKPDAPTDDADNTAEDNIEEADRTAAVEKNGAAEAAKVTTSVSSPTKPGVSFDPDEDEVKIFSPDDGDDDDLWEDVLDGEDDAEIVPPRNLFAEDAPPATVDQPVSGSEPAAANAAESAATDYDSWADLFDGGVPMSTKLYDDLEAVLHKISFLWDDKLRYKMACYDKLNVKEMKAILSSREQATSGTRDKLIRRLIGGDVRRLIVLRELGHIQQPTSTSAEDIAGVAESVNPRRVSLDPPPVADKEQTADDVAMETEEDALYEQSDVPMSTAADKKPHTPNPTTVSTPSTTASTAPPSASSRANESTSSGAPVQTPSQELSRLVLSSGRLLNTRPRRIEATDGTANFLVVSTPPITDRKQDIGKHAYGCLSKTFASLKKIDQSTVLYPLWGSEPGEEATPPITDIKDFPPDLDSLQSWAKVTNPWDFRKVKPGETDKDGNEKKQKGLYINILVGTKYSLEHVLEMANPSLSSIGCYVKRKDVDSLDSTSVKAFVGIPNEWDEESMTELLQEELEKHEEWMQGNVKHGFTAKQYMGHPMPPVVVRRTQIRLPERQDILSKQESECVEYAWSLRKVLTLEVSSSDKHRVLGVLTDFHARGKCRIFSADCDIMDLRITSRANKKVRASWYKELISHMNYVHLHSIVVFDGVTNVTYPARGEKDPKFHDNRRVFKNTCIKREMLDLRRLDGKKVFLGVIERSGDNQGSIQAYYYNDDLNEAFVNGINDNLSAFLFHYLQQVKGYSQRSTMQVLQGFTEGLRLKAPDSIWNSETRSVKSLQEHTTPSFAAKMAARGMDILLPEVLQLGCKAPAQKEFSDEAKKKVAEAMRFKDKPGYNPTSGDAASQLSDNSHTTDGAASNRSVTTTDIQTRMPELRLELNRLKQDLLQKSPDDNLLVHELFKATDVENMSISSSASAALAALYKDTCECIRLLKVRLGELGQNGIPPPSSGSAVPSSSDVEGGRGMAQGQ